MSPFPGLAPIRQYCIGLERKVMARLHLVVTSIEMLADEGVFYNGRFITLEGDT
jgi:hypothetical protein